jgi:hypothetical protein
MILHDFGWASQSSRTPVAAYLLPDGVDPNPGARNHNLIRRLASCELPQPKLIDVQLLFVRW